MDDMKEQRSAGWWADGEGISGGLGDWTFSSQQDCVAVLTREGGDSGSASALDVYRLEHDVALTSGETLHVQETFSATAWLRSPRRAVVFLNGSVFKSDSWHIPHPGYHAAQMAAERGMFAYTLDFLGSGRSSCPEDGREASFEANVDALRRLLRYVRYFRGVDRVDLVGEGYGGAMAAQLAADAERVRSCVMIAMLYEEVLAGPTQSPEFVAMIKGAPDGYFPLPPEGYDAFLSEAPEAVRNHVRTTQAGRYPAPVIEVAFDLPFFDPKVARAPGLVIYGGRDFVVARDDAERLAADYGLRGASLAISEAAGHAPRIESPEVASWLWSEIFGFIDGDRDPRDPPPATSV